MTQVLLLRGINVGGHGKLPMSLLKQALIAAGAERPETYIQSGNAVFAGDVDLETILEEVEARAGFSPEAVIIEAEEFLRMVAANPFSEAVSDPKSLHLFFLSEPSLATAADLAAASADHEGAILQGPVLYLHTPDYLSGSELASKLDRVLGVRSTGRNWRTVEKLAMMVESRR